jgi:hypothetical protein
MCRDCNKWKLKSYVRKTKIVIINKWRRPKKKEILIMKGQVIERVQEVRGNCQWVTSRSLAQKRKMQAMIATGKCLAKVSSI